MNALGAGSKMWWKMFQNQNKNIKKCLDDKTKCNGQ
jgi:hypothetical protein